MTLRKLHKITNKRGGNRIIQVAISKERTTTVEITHKVLRIMEERICR